MNARKNKSGMISEEVLATLSPHRAHESNWPKDSALQLWIASLVLPQLGRLGPRPVGSVSAAGVLLLSCRVSECYRDFASVCDCRLHYSE